MSDLIEQYLSLTAEQQKRVQLALCERAYVLWLAYVSQNELTEYIETVTGTMQKMDWQLPQDAIEAVREGKDERNITGRYMEPITALQDDDLEFPDEIEFAYYAIYNLFRFHVTQKMDDSWLIVNQALSALGADTAVTHLTAAIMQVLREHKRIIYERRSCLICGGLTLRPLLNLSESGMPHGKTGHNFTYACSAIAVCNQCGHGQLEKYSHDCFHHYEDEDWDMYWWFALTPADISRLRVFAERCSSALNVQCDCSVHRALRASEERLWGGVQHAISPEGKVMFVWLTLAGKENLLKLQVDNEKGREESS